MCSNAKIGSQTVYPGTSMIVHTARGTDMYTWRREQANARIESMGKYWTKESNIYVPLEGFFERGQLFLVETMRLFHVAALARNREFSIITRDAVDPVSSYHHRMPVILKDPELFAKTGVIKEIDYQLLKKG